jgi:DNA-binding transcriptional ArsR family regulator
VLGVNSSSAQREKAVSGLRALAHPLRLQMLSLLTGSAFSATELSRELGISQALASYHLRQLDRAGVVDLAEERVKRGGRERRFVYRPPSDRSGSSTDDEARTLVAEAIAVELRRRSHEAAPGTPQLGVDAELWVRPADWKTALEAVRAASIELHDRALPLRAPGTVRVSMSALLFTMTSEPVPGDG